VGQASGIGLISKDQEIVFYDIDRKKLNRLREQGYNTSTDLPKVDKMSEILMISVPTPTIQGQMNLSFVLLVAQNVGKALEGVGEYKLVTLRSTVLPTTTRCRVIPTLMKYSKLQAGQDFGVCFNPEFLTEKNALNDFLKPNRVIIGEFDKKSGDLLQKIYEKFKTKIIRTDLDTAEMIKYASNLFLATKISYFNEIYLICQKLGLDANIVSKAVALDPRIGAYGVHGGRPFGGKCLPKDLAAFTNFVKTLNLNPKLLDAISLINEEIQLHYKKKSMS